MTLDKCDNLIIDGNNICHINFHMCKEADDDTFIGLTFTITFNTFRKIIRKFNPKNVIIAFDNNSWRKKYTKCKDTCVTHKQYKGHRRAKLTPSEKERLEKLDNEMEQLAIMLKESSSYVVLRRNLLEADDLIAGFVQRNQDQTNIIVSSDKDFKQLINHNTHLYNSVEEDFRNLNDYNNDPELFMFEKCIRGDASDNIISSYPKLRSTKIIEAQTDAFKMANIMNHEYVMEDFDKDGNLIKHTYITKDVFEENMFLMNLTNQPDEIKQLIHETIDLAENNRSKFNLFNFLKFCSKYQMKNVLKSANDYTSVFSIKPKQSLIDSSI